MRQKPEPVRGPLWSALARLVRLRALVWQDWAAAYWVKAMVAVWDWTAAGSLGQLL
jgi:hypothetical protein